MSKKDPTKLSRIQLDRRRNEVKFFQKHIVEGKNVTRCSKEIGISKISLHKYKKSENFRQMALEYLDNSVLDGIKGTMCKLVDALDAVRPHNKETRSKDGSTKIEVIWVADTTARLKALQEVHKIYGIYAPQKRDIEVTVSISSDAELFSQIDEAERACKFVDSYEEREGRFELAPDPQGPGGGDFKSRKRAVLQDASIPQP